jgi:4'-phosphopantetheinyl transferase EntD
VGSITHTAAETWGFAGAACALGSECRALGLDAEIDTPLEPDLWPLVLTGEERQILRAGPEALRGFRGKLAFSAKEAVYKCQYPLTREFLEFPDLEIEADLACFTFRARFLRAAGAWFEAGSLLEGRFIRESGLIITAVELTRS